MEATRDEGKKTRTTVGGPRSRRRGRQMFKERGAHRRIRNRVARLCVRGRGGTIMKRGRDIT